jgi:hypothetical protein
MHKLLLPLDAKQFYVNRGRLFRLVRILADDGYHVDILSFGNEVYDQAVEAFKGNEKVGISLVRQDIVSQTEGFKEDLLKTFMRQTHNLVIPETDMKIYKLSAFDDFQGFIMPFT